MIDVTSYTGFPEIMDGRVKTLHPKVHGAILGRPTLPGDATAIEQHGIIPFQLVVVNLYPFQQTVARPDVTFDEAVENIDIGGPSMVRSAAKNHAHVAIVTQPQQYAEVLQQLRSGALDEAYRRRLAAAAFEMTATYDRAISDYLAKVVSDNSESSFGPRLTLSFRLQQTLRYGENPHQRARLLRRGSPDPWNTRNSSSAQRQGTVLQQSAGSGCGALPCWTSASLLPV